MTQDDLLTARGMLTQWRGCHLHICRRQCYEDCAAQYVAGPKHAATRLQQLEIQWNLHWLRFLCFRVKILLNNLSPFFLWWWLRALLQWKASPSSCQKHCILLTFRGPCIENVFLSITNKTQHYTFYLFLWNALNVSGRSSVHHQELKTVYTASGTLSNLYCYLPLSWNSWNSDVVYTVLSSWWWAEARPETLKHFSEINKLCNVASCWLYLKTLHSLHPQPVNLPS